MLNVHILSRIFSINLTFLESKSYQRLFWDNLDVAFHYWDSGFDLTMGRNCTGIFLITYCKPSRLNTKNFSEEKLCTIDI